MKMAEHKRDTLKKWRSIEGKLRKALDEASTSCGYCLAYPDACMDCPLSNGICYHRWDWDRDDEPSQYSLTLRSLIQTVDHTAILLSMLEDAEE